jgi:hypothetical protein
MVLKMKFERLIEIVENQETGVTEGKVKECFRMG